MERQFALPIAFAAALHGALLFGFHKTPQAKPPSKPDTIVVPFVIPPLPPEEPIVALDESAAAKSDRKPDVPALPRSEEPPAIDVPTAFRIPVPPVLVSTFGDVRQVLEIPPGVTSGNGDKPWGRDIIPSTHLDNAPRARWQVAPVYPYNAKKDGLRGEVLVEFIVDETGAVLEPRVVRASHPSFEEPSLRAIARWKFEPGLRNAQVVRFRMVVPVVFNLND